ncbi:MAG: DNA primase, partial [Candidatus Aureabacteria bacterium]|nr:DNA primase [Candidatus Auribacterota bacterium]
MPYLKQEDIERVLSSADIVDIIQRYVPLKQSGSNLKALCPFHNEKTPSFTVNRTKQIFHCFGCGAGGNVFSFIMQHEKVTFPEAVRIIAEILNIHLSEGTSGEKEKKFDYYRLNLLAAEYFKSLLFKEKTGAAWSFLKKRGINEKSVHEFFIGFAPFAFDNLIIHMKKQNISGEDLVQCGLAVERARPDSSDSEGFRLIDKFRNRIIFPVRSPSGKIIGFSGRCLDDSDIPKYLNTPETPVFRKREVLFGFFEARKGIQEKGFVFLMEGHIDVVLSHQMGVNNAVALQGTALTREHVQRLKNYTKKVVVCFDSDEAGVEAAKKALPLFLEFEMQAEVVLLPQDEDPASLLVKYGKNALRKFYQERRGLFDFKLDNLKKNNNILIPENKVEIIKEMFKDLKCVQNRILRDEYFRRMSASLDVDEQSLRKDFSSFLEKDAGSFSFETDETVQRRIESTPGEFELLKLLIHDKEFIARLISADFSPKNIQSESLKNIYHVLLEK